MRQLLSMLGISGLRHKSAVAQATLSSLLPTSAARKIGYLKGIHKGQRGVIVGMGPSLQIEDLDRLQGEICFACNKVYLAFPRTSWRPTYYSVCDALVAQNNAETIRNLELEKIFAAYVKDYFRADQDILWVRDLPYPVDDDRVRFSRNSRVGWYNGWTVIYQQLQLAHYMGIREVYLVGVDFKFQIPENPPKQEGLDSVIVNELEENHFIKGYRSRGEKWTVPNLDMQLNAFKSAKIEFEKSGGKIINASRQSDLDIFPRVDFDQVFPKQ